MLDMINVSMRTRERLRETRGLANGVHAIQCREVEWSSKPDWDPKQSAASRRKFFATVAGTDTLILPVHFPAPTAGLIIADGNRFNYRYRRD